MRDYECANLIADITAFYPQITDAVALANSYFQLIGVFEEPIARAAFMQLVKDPKHKYFPPPGVVYELCRELSRRKKPARMVVWRDQECVKNEQWLQIVRTDQKYREADYDGQVAMFGKHFFADQSAEFLRANFLDFDYIRLLNEACIGCAGVCQRDYSRGYYAAARLVADGEYVSIVMLACGRDSTD